MRQCFECNGECAVEYNEGEPPMECLVCKGSGEVEDGCYCSAYNPFECCCGCDWGDLDTWEDY